MLGDSAKFRRRTRRASCCVALASNDDDPTAELHYGGPTTIGTEPLVAFIKEIQRLNRRAASWTAFAALLEGLATIAHIMDDEPEEMYLSSKPRR